MKNIGLFILILIYSACVSSCDEKLVPADNKEFVKQFSSDLDVIEKTIKNGKVYNAPTVEKKFIIENIKNDLEVVRSLANGLTSIYEKSTKEQRNELGSCSIESPYYNLSIYGKEINKLHQCIIKDCPAQVDILKKIELIDEISSKNIAQCKKAIDALK